MRVTRRVAAVYAGARSAGARFLFLKIVVFPRNGLAAPRRSRTLKVVDAFAVMRLGDCIVLRSFTGRADSLAVV